MSSKHKEEFGNIIMHYVVIEGQTLLGISMPTMQLKPDSVQCLIRQNIYLSLMQDHMY